MLFRMEQAISRADPLTGARSRQGFETELQDVLAAAGVSGQPTALLILDLDHFKSINDVFGHARGDQILIDFVGRIGELVRGSDLLFRYGGDEFVLVLPHTNLEQASGLAERLLAVIKGRPFGEEPPLSVSVSIGLAAAEPGQESPSSLFERADFNLLAAKRAGRGRLVLVDTAAEVGSSRLLEREAASQSAHRFFKGLPQLRRAALVVLGAGQVGHSGFLREVGQAAQLLGYRVVHLVGRSAYVTHPFGALLDGLGIEDCEPLIAGDIPALMARLGKAKQGLIWCIDRLDRLDAASLNTLQRLMQSSEGPVMGLVVAATAETRAEAWLGSLPQEHLSLTPLSLGASKVFLRTQLHWEAPEGFVEWLWRQSQGLPGRMLETLEGLQHCKALIAGSEGFALMPDYAQRLEDWVRPALPVLPKPNSSLIGRDREVVLLKQLLRERRLVSVVGQGGMGKTHLVSQVALEVEHLYPDGVVFISLASLAQSEGLPLRLAQELGISPRGDVLEALRQHLSTQEMLLVLDNLEHLLDGVEFFSQLLAESGLTLLTTSRERLRLPEEWVYELGGLQSDSSPSDPMASGAIRLLLQAARRVEPNLSFDQVELQAAGRICRLVEGMPLGLELAAAWVKVLPLAEIALEIEANQNFLSLPDTQHSLPKRHHSLSAAFDSSWAFLEPGQQKILAKLALFRGGFDRKAAEAVTGASVSSLLSLISLSLLKRDLQHSGRYQMHELLRQFALAKLEQMPHAHNHTQQAQAEYYLGFAERISPELKGAQQAEGLEQVAFELDNLRSALHTFRAIGDAERGTRLIAALEWFFYVRGLFAEGAQWLNGFLQDRLLTDSTRAKGLRALASFNKELGKTQHSQTQLEQSLELFRAIGDTQGEAGVLHLLGVVAREAQRFEQALEYLKEGLRLSQQQGDGWSIGSSFNDLAIVHAYLGQDAQAKELFQRSLEVKQEIGDLQGIAYAIANLGHFHDTPDQRIAAQEESLIMKRRLNDRQGIANSVNNLGVIYSQQHNFPLAQARLLEGLALYLELSNPSRMTSSLVAYAHMLCDLGYTEIALEVAVAVETWRQQASSAIMPETQRSFEQLKQNLAASPESLGQIAPMGLEAMAQKLIGSSSRLVLHAPSSQASE